MRTLADFKRALKVGSKWELRNHLWDGMPLAIRIVEKIQSKAVAFRVKDGLTWLTFPKAKQVKIRDGVVEIYSTVGTLLLSYKAVNE